jgi:hypothetical protein
MSNFKKIEVSDALLNGVKKSLEAMPEVFSFESHPQLASILASLGLCFEINNSDWNRLGAPLGVEPQAPTTTSEHSSWEAHLVEIDGAVGLRATLEGVEKFSPDHPDFGYVLHPSSLNQEGEISQIVISPLQVAQFMQSRGLEAVIVKDWVLSSFLAEEKQRENYQVTNLREVESNIALLQTELMLKKQLSLSGTHDLVDHVLDLCSAAFIKREPLLRRVRESLLRLQELPQKRALVVSYFMGVLLDDMAQPRWYDSEAHDELLENSLLLLDSVLATKDWEEFHFPEAFDRLVGVLRDPNRSSKTLLESGFSDFKEKVLS